MQREPASKRRLLARSRSRNAKPRESSNSARRYAFVLFHFTGRHVDTLARVILELGIFFSLERSVTDICIIFFLFFFYSVRNISNNEECRRS